MSLKCFEIAAFIGAIVFVVLWLANPDSGNWEAWSVLCGLVGFGIELYRRSVTSKTERGGIGHSPSLNSEDRTATAKRQSIQEQTDKGAPVDLPAPKHKEVSHSLLYKDVLVGLDKNKYTDLQRTQFAKRVSGTSIEWRVKVESISPSSSVVEECDIFMVFSDPNDESTFPTLGVADFDHAKELELTPLKEGDIVLLSGELNLNGSVSSYKVSVQGSGIIAKVE